MKLEDKHQAFSNYFLILLIYALFFISQTTSIAPVISVLIVFVGVITYMIKRSVSSPLIWWALLLVLVCNFRYYLLANHYLLLMYMIFATALYFTFSLNQKDFLLSVKYLGAAVMLTAGFQKMMSPEFISGAYCYQMIHTGVFFNPIFRAFQFHTDEIRANEQDLYHFIRSSHRFTGKLIFRELFRYVREFSIVFSWTIILYEILLGCLLLYKPSWKGTHILFVLLILGVFLTRPAEVGFLTLLSIIGLFLTKTNFCKMSYLILIAFLSSLILTNQSMT